MNVFRALTGVYHDEEFEVKCHLGNCSTLGKTLFIWELDATTMRQQSQKVVDEILRTMEQLTYLLVSGLRDLEQKNCGDEFRFVLYLVYL